MIVGISGKKQHGKDTVAKIIEYVTDEYYHHKGLVTPLEDWSLVKNSTYTHHWQRKIFASKLKQIVCLLIGCTMEQLEDNDFKEKELGEEWWYWKVYTTMQVNEQFVMLPYNKEKSIYEVPDKPKSFTHHSLIRLTPRLLLQYIGTECGRTIIHPNIWVNALMSDYIYNVPVLRKGYIPFGRHYILEEDYRNKVPDPRLYSTEEAYSMMHPNWIITDVRFPNEVEAIKSRGGIVIRVNRPMPFTGMPHQQDLHQSETALDDYSEWDQIITNESLEMTILQTRIMLQNFKLI